jgi:hypothetical protein
MNPNSGEAQRNIELPGLSGEELEADNSLENSPTQSPENSPQTQSVTASSQAASSIALPAQDIAGKMTDDDDVATDDQVQATATDSDRIEKQWVDKAKTIVARTKDDPHEQKTQMSKVKAEYIKTRFNKTVKADDSVTK